MSNSAKKKTTIPSISEKKARGERLTMITVYDYPFARLVDRSEAELILVGDSLGMVIQGKELTNPVTLEEVIYHVKAVRRGAPNTLVVGDMPFMSYQISPEQALASAGRIVKEGGADCVKMEGGEYFAPYVRKIVQAGIPVMGHIGLTPQSASALGGFKVQGRTPEQAKGFLNELGNPYTAVIADPANRQSIEWGVYALPETFVIDGSGTVVLHIRGPINEPLLEKRLKPAIAAASAE